MRVLCTDSLDWVFLQSAEHYGHSALLRGITLLPAPGDQSFL